MSGAFKDGETIMPGTILIPLPNRDFDVTEVAVPWRLLTRAGYQTVFATEDGSIAQGDPKLLKGVIFGQLGAAPDACAFYREMIESPAFLKPILWAAIEPAHYDALLLPGGHAPGMRQYLGSVALQQKVTAFWALQRPVAAICHGVLVLARARDSAGRSLLANRKTTSLRKWQERTAWLMTRWWLGNYYRTYEQWVEDEVCEHLHDPAAQYQTGPFSLLQRGTETDDTHAFIVQDGHYISARWPGDAFLMARALMRLLENRHGSVESVLQNQPKASTVDIASGFTQSAHP